MKISNHRLLHDDGTAVPFIRSPNVGGALKPRWLVMHFTADGGNTAIDWFSNPKSRASAHLVVSREGKVTQMVPFDRIAWHAGRSLWKGVPGLNSHSIGIEMVNYGELHRHPEKGWMRYWKQDDGSWKWIGPAVAPSEILPDGSRTIKGQRLDHGWQRYTPAQVAASLEAARALVAAYRLEDVVGHEQISPGRKVDPGPAFDLAGFRAAATAAAAPPPAGEPAVPGRRPRSAVMASALNVRSGPGTSNPTVAGSPLPRDTIVEELETSGGWTRVRARDGRGTTGWVSAQHLAPAILDVPLPDAMGHPSGI